MERDGATGAGEVEEKEGTAADATPAAETRDDGEAHDEIVRLSEPMATLHAPPEAEQRETRAAQAAQAAEAGDVLLRWRTIQPANTPSPSQQRPSRRYERKSARSCRGFGWRSRACGRMLPILRSSSGWKCAPYSRSLERRRRRCVCSRTCMYMREIAS